MQEMPDSQPEAISSKERTKLLVPVLVLFVAYVAYSYAMIYYLHSGNTLLRLTDVSAARLCAKLWYDVLLALPFPLAVAMWQWFSGKRQGFSTQSAWLCAALLAVYILQYWLHADASVRGVYRLVYYLFWVATMEELFFRGFCYRRLKPLGGMWATIISGVLFGVMHAVMPAALADEPWLLLDAVNHIGGGIIGGLLFVVLLEWSANLAVPILVHALLDGAYGAWGMVACVLTLLFLGLRRHYVQEKPLFDWLKPV